MSQPPPSAEGSPSAAAPAAERPRIGDRGYLTAFAGLPATGFSWVTALLAILIAFGVLSVGLLFVGAADPGVETNAGKAAAQVMVIIAFAGTALAFGFADADGRLRGALDRFGLRRLALWMVGLAALAWFAYAALQTGLAPLIHPDQDDVTKELGTNDSSAFSVTVTVLLVVVGAALSEELLFRGIVFAGLRRSMSIWPAALISAVLWALLHLSAANLAVVGVLAIFGLVLAWLYERTGSLWAPICAHMINNAIAVLALLLS